MASYSLLYFSEFTTLKSNKVRVEILSNSSSVKAPKEVLLTGDEPVLIEYDSDDIFKPLKQSSCKLQIVTDEPLLDLYTGKINEIITKIYLDQKLFWYGFLTPNVYSSDYSSALVNTFTLEFIDIVAQLDNLKFSSGLTDFKTFKGYIDDAINQIDIEGIITDVVQTDKSRIDIAEVGCLARNFIDETNDTDEGAMTYKEVFESIISYLGLSMIYWQDKIYIFNPLESNGTTPVKTLKQVGTLNDDAQIALGNIYNKVTVIANNNPISAIVPDLFDGSNLFVLTDVNGNPYVIDYYKIINDDETKEYYLLSGFGKNKLFGMIYDYGDVNLQGDYASGDQTSASSRYLNCVIQKYAHYDKNEVEPSNLDWKTCLTWKVGYTTNNITNTPIQNTVATPLSFTGSPKDYFVGKGGYFIIDLSYMLSESNGQKENNSHNFIQPTDNDWFRYPEAYGHPHSIVRHTPYTWDWATGKLDAQHHGNDGWEYWNGVDSYQFQKEKVKEYHTCTLRIGDYAWNGSEWVKVALGTFTVPEFKIPTSIEYSDKVVGVERHCDNNVSFSLGLADSHDGYIIPLPENKVLSGTISFSIGPCSTIRNSRMTFGGGFGSSNGSLPNSYANYGRYFTVSAEFMTGLSVKYTTKDSIKDIFNLEQYNPDVTYTNIIDTRNVTEFGDITLTTNTYTPYATSYSYAMKRLDNGEFQFIEEIDGQKQEEYILQRYTDYYSNPKLQFSSTLQNGGNTTITPFSKIKVESLNKTMTVDSCSFDLKLNAVNVTIKET